MRRALLLAALVATSLTAGCLGGVDAAKISGQTLNDKGWSETNRNSKSVGGGLGELVQIEYKPDTGQTKGTGAIVATANNVPILDESRFIPQAIKKVEQKRNVDFQKTGKTPTVSLPNLGGAEVTGTVYKFQKSGAEGKAILFTPDQCDAFVVTVGYGIIEAPVGSGLSQTYPGAKDVARGVTC